jgi:2,4-dienoyl-CoA reductase (NADPH2)
VLVVGGGPAGLETARVAAARGHRVRLVERRDRLGGMAAIAGPGRALADWLIAECTRAGVDLQASVASVAPNESDVVVQCTGSVAGRRTYEVADGTRVLDVAEVRSGRAELPVDGFVVLFDPIGGPIAVALAEELGERAILVTQDQIAGNELSRTGDLAPANTRLQQRGVRIERRALLREVHTDHVVVEDRFSGVRRRIDAVAVVDCGFRLPSEPLPYAHHASGDCVAPRTILEAILESRRVALAI